MVYDYMSYEDEDDFEVGGDFTDDDDADKYDDDDEENPDSDNED